MPKWIHDRAAHIRAKNPDMGESTSWAIATQQSHAMGKSPKKYGTTLGKRVAKAKHSTGTKSWVRGADPKKIGAKMIAKEKKAMELSDMPTSYEMAKLGGFSDEFQKIASTAGDAARRVGQLFMGGAKGNLKQTTSTLVPKTTTVTKQPGTLAKFFGKKPTTSKVTEHVPGKKTVTFEGAGPRPGNLGVAGIKDKATRSEALRSLGVRAAAGAGALTAGKGAVKGHRKKERKQLGRAYVHGARDMYSRVSSRRR